MNLPNLFCVAICLCLTVFNPFQTNAQDSPIVGNWNVTADTNDGEMTNTWTFQESKTGITGTSVNKSTGTMDRFRDVSFQKNQLLFEFDLDYNGERILVKVETEISENKLIGTWTAFTTDGSEVATGPIKGTKSLGQSPASSRNDKMQTLFDGKSLENFRGYQSEQIGAGWSVDDGTIFFDGNRSGDLVTKQQFGNFDFEFEWKISAGGNSGVLYRVTLDEKKPFHTGPEYQLLDDTNHKDGKNENTSSGALYALYAPKDKKLNPVGQWNQSKIIVDGDRVEHWLNGVKIVDVTIGSSDWKSKVEGSKFNKFKRFGSNVKGHVVFQDHGDPVWFRNLKIRSLDK